MGNYGKKIQLRSSLVSVVLKCLICVLNSYVSFERHQSNIGVKIVFNQTYDMTYGKILMFTLDTESMEIHN